MAIPACCIVCAVASSRSSGNVEASEKEQRLNVGAFQVPEAEPGHGEAMPEINFDFKPVHE